jgi:TRAP-type C4-dicarboxylate transport system permease small subunit
MKNLLEKANTGAEYFRKLTVALVLCASIVNFAMMLYITVDVCGRYLANKPLPASYEIVGVFMILIVFFSLAYAQDRGSHLRLEFLRQRLSDRWETTLDALALLIGIVFFGIITWQAGQWAWKSWQKNEIMHGVLNLPFYLPKLILTIGAFLLWIQFIIDFIKRIHHLLSTRRTR